MFSTESTVLSLESILQDPSSESFNEFATFLNQSYCIENLYFWLATQEYHQEFNNKREQLCESMINLYIRPNSPQEINIPCDMRQSILDYYNTGNVHLRIFDDAAEAVLELMRVNSFLPWITVASLSTASISPPNTWSSFDSTTVMSKSSSSSSTSSANTAKQHKSWPSPQRRNIVNNSPSSTSLSGLTTSFSFSEEWNKLKHTQNSRKSCSSLADYSPSFLIDNDSDQQIDSIFSVRSVTTTDAVASTSTSSNLNTRYRSMLKRVKKSLLGSSSAIENDLLTVGNTPPTSRSSFTAVTETAATTVWSSSSWRKSQR